MLLFALSSQNSCHPSFLCPHLHSVKRHCRSDHFSQAVRSFSLYTRRSPREWLRTRSVCPKYTALKRQELFDRGLNADYCPPVCVMLRQSNPGKYEIRFVASFVIPLPTQYYDRSTLWDLDTRQNGQYTDSCDHCIVPWAIFFTAVKIAFDCRGTSKLLFYGCAK